MEQPVCSEVGAACGEQYVEEQTCEATGATASVWCHMSGVCAGIGDANECNLDTGAICDDPCGVGVVDTICSEVGADCSEHYPEIQTCAITGADTVVQCHKYGSCTGVGDGSQCSWGQGSWCEDPCAFSNPPDEQFCQEVGSPCEVHYADLQTCATNGVTVAVACKKYGNCLAMGDASQCSEGEGSVCDDPCLNAATDPTPVCVATDLACQDHYVEVQTCAPTGDQVAVWCHKYGTCLGPGDGAACTWGDGSWCDDPCADLIFGAEPVCTGLDGVPCEDHFAALKTCKDTGVIQQVWCHKKGTCLSGEEETPTCGWGEGSWCEDPCGGPALDACGANPPCDGDAICSNGACVEPDVHPGGTCGNTRPVDAVPFVATGSTAGSPDNFSYAAGSCPGVLNGWGSGAPDHIYQFVPSVSSTYSIRLTPSFDGHLYLIKGCDSAAEGCQIASQEVGVGMVEELDFPLQAGASMYIIVDGAEASDNPALNSGDYILSVEDCGSLCSDPPESNLDVMVLVFDPVLEALGGLRLSEVMGWADPVSMSLQLAEELEAAASGTVKINFVKWAWTNAFPQQADGFVYSDEDYLAGEWHLPEVADYSWLLSRYGIRELVNSGKVDEVWVWGGPHFGLAGATMMGASDSYWLLGPGVNGVDLDQRIILMGFPLHRTVEGALHTFGHRIEGIMAHVYGSWDNELSHAWDQFTAIEKDHPGQAACGTVHYPPNGVSDGNYANPGAVPSTCEEWPNYPELTGVTTNVSGNTWGASTIGGFEFQYLRWWIGNLPRSTGETDEKQNNWWRYIIDFVSYD
ncbi:MAG: hypothetical protein CMH54_08545 [Myxococcales bacterium]|nr:hypothetical protein [Myxococcales bacterium]